MRSRISQAAVAAAPSPSPSRNGVGTKAQTVVSTADAAVESQVEESRADWRAHIDSRLDHLESLLQILVEQRTVKDWYSTGEAAKILGKAEFTVREWCRLGRIHAEKKGSGRGKYQSWVISNEELLRIQKEGLLPIRRA